MVVQQLVYLATARATLSGAGTGLLGLASGGATAPGTASNATEEWTVPETISNLTITD